MVYINNKSKINNIKLTKYNFYVVIDFDKTITDAVSVSSWGVMTYAPNMPQDYTQIISSLYNHYRPIELDSTISEEEKSVQMSNWWNANLDLLFENELKENELNEAVKLGRLKYREGAKAFLKRMNQLNIPVIIISAGIGNVIQKFLEDNGDYYANIKIISNFIEFENGIIKKISNKLIHSINKNIVKLDEESKNQISSKEYILLIGDNLADIKMIPTESLKNAITVGFLDENIEENLKYFNKEFDIVISNNGSFEELNFIIDKLVSKNELRKEYILKRKHIENKSKKSEEIVKKVIETEEYKSAKVVALYKSLPSEVDTTRLIEHSLSVGKVVVLPKVVNDELEFYIVNSLEEDLIKSKFGVQEPVGREDAFVDKSYIDLVIVPGVCFDKEGGRMGFGKGYYDRYLANTNLKTIGICFKEQLVDKVILEDTDVKMQKIITD